MLQWLFQVASSQTDRVTESFMICSCLLTSQLALKLICLGNGTEADWSVERLYQVMNWNIWNSSGCAPVIHPLTSAYLLSGQQVLPLRGNTLSQEAPKRQKQFCGSKLALFFFFLNLWFREAPWLLLHLWNIRNTNSSQLMSHHSKTTQQSYCSHIAFYTFFFCKLS